MNKFDSTFNYKVIYIFSINIDSHKGMLKIGDTTLKTENTIDKLFPNCSDLNKVANDRIRKYTNTAGIKYTLHHTEIAIKNEVINRKEIVCKAFRDYDVHNILKNSGISCVSIDKTTGKEWFKIKLETAIDAIAAVKNGEKKLANSKLESNLSTIIFRPEQEDAIEKTIRQFRKNNKMLWNAKMRFGKTLCSLEVVKRMNFKKTIIMTHRPVVNDGWYEDFKNIFIKNDEFIYGSRAFNTTIDELLQSSKNFVYFASVQDLRGSDKVGGKFNKNNEIFDINWDFVVVDEAHEGTTTSLGEEVITQVLKPNSHYPTKFLALSGTPFNILNNYEENELYTWDYVMEQKSKLECAENSFGDYNPYGGLPELHIYTYNLGKVLGSSYVEIEDKAFNFREFFRTWTGDKKNDFENIPIGHSIGDFCHEDDIKKFLNLITKEDKISQYPYANEEYRNLFKHSLWMVPGVKEARALKKLMEQHPVFGCGMFEIVNVAGDGDEEEKPEEALTKVKNAIKNALKLGNYTITLSCGKLTTGVTIPEWTAVMMLSGSYSTSAANYLQTIFRVQSPGNVDGKIKENCYVFDFAPDRTLKMVADAVNLSTKAGKTSLNDRESMREFLNFCPVISIEGTKMEKYDENKLLQQLKRAYAERAVMNGFDDNNLYNDIELSKLTEGDLEKFSKLQKIVGQSKPTKEAKEININNIGLTNEEYEELERVNKKNKKERTPEEQKRLEELKEKQNNRAKAISNLRAISIRIPLLIYGAEVDFDNDITAENLIDLVDNLSWEEFMPAGMSKEIFKEFIKYYDTDVFTAAGRKIKNMVKVSDSLPPKERIEKIIDLLSKFKNPDKETVLTPWRVVNMHIGDCLGGYNFYNENFSERLEQVRFIDKGEVTENIFKNPNVKILEINSKTGLYPLYMTYSIFSEKCKNIEILSREKEEEIWEETIKNNLFILCKTPMAKAVTKRTLLGYKDLKINSHYFNDLINQLKNKPEKFVDKIIRPNYWGLKGSENMKFDAIVGNPPYQESDGGAVNSATPIYNLFVEQSKNISPKYMSMIIPARWYVGGKGLDKFRIEMLNDKRIEKIVDYPNSTQVFNNVDIAGGVCYFLWNKNFREECTVKTVTSDSSYEMKRNLNEFDIFVRDSNGVNIIRKINKNYSKNLGAIVSSRKPFGLPTNYKEKEHGIPCYFIQKIGKKFADKQDIKDSNNYLEKWKLLVPKAPIAGQTDFSKSIGFYNDGNTNIAAPGECCTESFIIAGAFSTEEEVLSYKSYLFTKIVRFLLLQAVISQDVTKKNFCFIPDLEKYNQTYSDDILRKMWNLTEEEWNYIDSRIK